MSPLPLPDIVREPFAQPYWDAAADGKLVLPLCVPCDRSFWYPRPFCPSCGSSDITWVGHIGQGRVYTYTVVHRAPGAWADAVPYVAAWVKLDSGPTVLANIVGCDVDAVQCDLEVTATFRCIEASSSPDGPIGQLQFRPTTTEAPTT